MMPTDAFISCGDANGWRDGSWVILNEVYKGGRLWEAMGGTGGSPLNFLYFTFLYVKSGGWPPVPPIASFLSFLFSK